MALATRYNEKAVSIVPTVSIPQKKIASVASMDVRLQGRVLSIDVPGMRDGKFSVVDVRGAKVAAGALHDGRATVNLESVKSGVYMVKVAGLGAKRIVVR
jgi:hypothetical protein